MLGLLVVIGGPSLIYSGQSFWELPVDLALAVLVFAAGYAASRFGSERRGRSPWQRLLIAAVGIGLSVAAAFSLQFLRPDIHVSRAMALIGAGLGLLLVVLREAPRRPVRRAARLVVLVGAAWVFAAAAADAYRVATTMPPPSNTSFVVTSHLAVELVTYEDIIPAADIQRGGAITRIGNHVVGVTGKGSFFLLTRDAGSGAVISQRLPWRSPSNRDEFAAAGPSGVDLTRFRVQDFIARPSGQGWEVFASHHVWDGAERCFSLALSRLEVDAALTTLLDDWQELLRIRPCLPVGGQLRGESFSGHESGGILAWFSPDALLWTTGDHEFDGWHRPQALAQDERAQYGKTLLVNLTSRQATTFSRGHRNPQGLYIDPSGTIWSTEQGPEGGDELNLIIRDGNYGWPRATHGTEYHRTTWPLLQQVPGDRPPVYAWVPSLAITSVIGVQSPRFPQWSGNLLVASLAGRTVSLVVLRGQQVEYVEPIRIGRRVRDLVETPDGDIWLWGDEGDLITMTPAARASRGEELYAGCTSCHSQFDAVGGLGPSLYDIVDREVASDPHHTYSEALKRVGGRWTRERLDEFLANPGAFAPGTTMTVGVSDAADRAALIDFLARVPRDQ